MTERDERTRLILETANDAFVAIDLDGVITEWNRMAERMFGLPRAAAVGRPLAETIIPTRFRDAHRAGLAGYLATGHGPVLFNPVEVAGLHATGAEFPVELTVWPVEVDGLQTFNAFIRDISERKRNEAFVHLLQAVAVAANEAATFEDALQTCIDEVCRATGWPVGHAYVPVGDPVMLQPTRLWHLDNRASLRRFVQATERTPLAPGVGLPGRVFADGKPAWLADVAEEPSFVRWTDHLPLEVRAGFAFPVMSGREVVAVLEFYSREAIEPDPALLDVLANAGTQVGRVAERTRSEETLQRANAELLAADRLKNEFLSTVSHELRTPLTAIIGFSSMMRDRWEAIADAPKREWLETIDDQAQHLSGLVDDLLTTSRILSGTLKPRPTKFPLAEAVGAALAALVPGLVDVQVECAPDLVVRADRDQVVRIVGSFLANAAAYGAPPFSVQAHRADDAVVLRVRDSGSGVPLEFVPRLFEVFAQASTGNTRESRGLGLGLTIARAFARTNGGDAWFEPNPPTGACFAVSLPAAANDARAAQPSRR